jgi:putative ABC transport system substrate-binding protein
MTRREFIIVLSGAAVWPVAARAEQTLMPVIGFLGSESPALFASPLRLFRQGLRETGYVEGQNVAIEYLWAEGQNDRLPALAADLVRRKVRIIAAPGTTPAALAAKAATTTIPIVFFTAADPVALGLVASLSRPGGNLTGATSLGSELAPKRLELLHQLLPTATVMAGLVNPTNPAVAESTATELQEAARRLGLRLHIMHASADRDFDSVFATLVRLRAAHS